MLLWNVGLVAHVGDVLAQFVIGISSEMLFKSVFLLF